MSFFKGYVHQKKQQDFIKKKQQQRKSEEKKALLVFLIAIVAFISVIMDNSFHKSTNISKYKEQSCVEKHKENYQAYLYCQRLENFNR